MDINNLWEELGIRSDFYHADCLEVNTILAARYLTGPQISKGGSWITYEGFDLEREERIVIQEYFPERTAFRNAGSGFVGCGFAANEQFQFGMNEFMEDAVFMSHFSDTPGLSSVKTSFFENGTAYVIRERFEGMDFYAYIRAKGGKLAESEALALMRPMIKALGRLHSSGIYHGELTKNSMLISDNGQMRLLGVDRNRKFGAATKENEPVILLTDESAPEQYGGVKKTGPWTDVYGICAVLYHALCGRYVPQVSERWLGKDFQSFEELGVEVSANTERAITKGLALDVNDRIQSMDELMEYLYEGKQIGTGKTWWRLKRGRR